MQVLIDGHEVPITFEPTMSIEAAKAELQTALASIGRAGTMAIYPPPANSANIDSLSRPCSSVSLIEVRTIDIAENVTEVIRGLLSLLGIHAGKHCQFAQSIQEDNATEDMLSDVLEDWKAILEAIEMIGLIFGDVRFAESCNDAIGLLDKLADGIQTQNKRSTIDCIVQLGLVCDWMIEILASLAGGDEAENYDKNYDKLSPSDPDETLVPLETMRDE